MKEKGVIDIQLEPIKLPRMGEVIDLLKNWYIQQTGPAHLKTIQDTEYVLRLWGRIGEKEKPEYPMKGFVIGDKEDS
tara:strand:+ start:326 stop:556 length:231 start_codon:yes stop_codon:yes gene_type:complete